LIKFKYIDYLIGFSLALLASMPMLRTQFPIPSIGLLIPIMMMFGLGSLKVYSKGTLSIRLNTAGHFYFLALLFVYLLASAIWNPFEVSAGDAVLKIILIIITVVSVIISVNERATHHFINWVIFFAIIAALTLFTEYLRLGNFSGYRLSDTLVRPQLMGLGTIFAVTKLLFFEDVKRKRYLAITGFLLFGLAFGGARGALLIAFGICMMILGYYFYSFNPKSYSLQEWLKNKSLRIFSVTSIILVIIAALQIERTANKMRRLFFGGELVHGERAELWANSFISYLDSPFIGFGLRSSGILSYDQANYYPHNMFLEVMLDGGVIALVFLLIVIFYPIIRTIELLRNNRLKSKLWLPLLAGYFFLIFEFSKSSTFFDSRMIFVLATTIIIVVEDIKVKQPFKLQGK